MRKIPTCIVGGNKLFREGLKSLLSGTEYRPLAMGHHVSELKSAASREAKFFLIGLQASDKDDMMQLRAVRAHHPDSRIIVITTAESRKQFTDCLSAGMDGYLAADDAAPILVQSLRLITRGVQVFPTKLMMEVLARNEEEPEPSGANPSVKEQRPLSRREQQVLALLVDGASNRAIASRLNIEDSTVKVHLRKILKKIPAANRTQAAVWAAGNGFQGVPAL